MGSIRIFSEDEESFGFYVVVVIQIEDSVLKYYFLEIPNININEFRQLVDHGNVYKGKLLNFEYVFFKFFKTFGFFDFGFFENFDIILKYISILK